MGAGGAAESACNNGSARKPEVAGAAGFKRHNPMTDLFGVKRFHHVEFWCADATSTWKRCAWVGAPGLPQTTSCRLLRNTQMPNCASPQFIPAACYKPA